MWDAGRERHIISQFLGKDRPWGTMSRKVTSQFSSKEKNPEMRDKNRLREYGVKSMIFFFFLRK